MESVCKDRRGHGETSQDTGSDSNDVGTQDQQHRERKPVCFRIYFEEDLLMVFICVSMRKGQVKGNSKT